MEIRAPGCRSGNVEQERGGNIVWEVAHDSKRRRQSRKVETQRIGLVHRQAVHGVTLAQAPAQVPVELHDVEVLDPLEQRGRQRTESGADFNEVLAPVRIDCGDDVLDGPPVDEKMLTESFSRDMPTGRHCLAGPVRISACAISIAASTASMRLSGSA